MSEASPVVELGDLPLPLDSRTEILLRIPTPPNALLRVSHVCREWRRLVADRSFLRSFRARHNDAPPLVGVFHNSWYEGTRRFTPTGEDPMPARAFDCPAHWRVLDCRHGRVLFLAAAARSGDYGAPPVLVLWDPLTRWCKQIRMPPDWMIYNYNKLSGAVVCRAGTDAEGRHGDYRSGPFRVVLLIGREPGALLSVYSSEAGDWVENISFDGLPLWGEVVPKPSVVTGNTLCHPVSGCHIIAFDLESKSFSMIPPPPEAIWMDGQIVGLAGGTLGLVVADSLEFSLHLWVRKDAGDWVRRWTLQLDTLEPLSAAAQPGAGGLRDVKLVGACEYGNIIFLWTKLGCFLFYLDTMKLKLLDDSTMMSHTVHPYQSFFAPPQQGLRFSNVPSARHDVTCSLVSSVKAPSDGC